MSQIKLSEINSEEKYTGYLWFSNEDKPQLFENDSLSEIPSETGNPFIVEGHLISENGRYSVMLRHDGVKTQVYRYNWSEFENREVYMVDEPVCYLMKGGENGRKVCFRRVWKAEIDDPENPEFKVFKPLFIGFTGFSN
jgi:CRISPR type III-associated protein (TIGR04423 family)